ncbi:MAG: hypothetical protein H7Y04_05640 [Verrucomicrobia bacterium]|jgi:acetolactate synthase small subunit|nr:hypothetical protein [Cytophagales bacterium]
MKKDFTLEILADNNFSILNRIINVLNRRRIRIRKLSAMETEDDISRGVAIFIIYSTSDMMEKVKGQLEKLIEVEKAVYHPGSEVFYELAGKYKY